MDIQENILIFDGVCNLCNSSVNFIISKDHNNSFKFASMHLLIGGNERPTPTFPRFS